MNVHKLTRTGFVKAGEFLHAPLGEALTLTHHLPSAPGVYAFAIDGLVVYFGAAENLHNRVLSYRRRTARHLKRLPIA